jgi:hypothetical protein
MLKQNNMFKQDFDKIYYMIHPNERIEIIKKIIDGEIISETFTGIKYNWWINKHNPNNKIPKNIYLLGKGTIQELHIKYIKKYGNIEWKHFINYTRELIKQKIMI